MGLVVTVSGSVGGIGASTLTFALALQAGPDAVLIDGCPGLPLDLLIGAEARAGARWSQVRIRSSDVEPDAIRAALPEHLGIRVLASDADGLPDGAAIAHLAQVLASGPGTVVVDLGGRDPLRPVLRPELDVLLLPPSVHGVAAARLMALPGTRGVLVRTGAADVPDAAIPGFTGIPVEHSVRWQRSVTLAARAGVGLPPDSDAMVVASRLLEGVGHGH